MMQIIYRLFALIDSIIYGLASSMFRIIYDIANTQFFKEEQITSVANRIYVVIGVLMLFKLVISAVQYMVNPDTFDDKEKGLAGLLKKTVISLALIVLVPTIFKFMIVIQEPIIKTLPSIILGSDASEKVDDESLGFDLSFRVLSSFVKERDGKGGSVGDRGEIHDVWSFQEHIMDGCPAVTFFGLISTDGCQYDYMIIISTICGGFLCYMLLTMILDVAIRTIKFGVIQLLAPIPISSYIFSKDKLNKFVKMTMSVYTDLFIRMAIVYFIIFALKAMLIDNDLLNVLSINKGGVSDTGDWFRGVIVNISLIFGLLMFASKAPKFLSELLGLPDVGSGEMADMFKPAWQRAGGFRAITGMAGAGLANMANKISQNNGGDPNASFWQKTKNTMKDSKLRREMFKSGIGGAASAGFHGGIAAMQGKNGAEVNKAGYKRAIQARTRREISTVKGASGFGAMFERAAIRAQDYAGLVTPVSLMESQQKAMSAVSSAEKGEIDRTKIILNANAHAINANGSTAMSSSLHTLATNFLSQVNATTATNAQTGRIEINSGVGDVRLKNMMESIVNGDKVALSEILSFADYTGENGELKQISTLLKEDGDYRRNLHKNATQDAYNGGVEQMRGGTFKKLDSSSDEFDTQLKGFHSNLVSSFVDHADSLGVLKSKVEEIARNKGYALTRVNGESDADFLERAYREHTRDFESAMDEAVTTINSAFTDLSNPQNAKLKRERVIREDIKRRNESNKNS